MTKQNVFVSLNCFFKLSKIFIFSIPINSRNSCGKFEIWIISQTPELEVLWEVSGHLPGIIIIQKSLPSVF